MSEYLVDPNILGLLLLVSSAIAAIALLSAYISPHLKKEPEETVPAMSEWRPTGKIDFHSPEPPKEHNVPAAFFLRIEDYRSAESISGVEHMEIRWRNATLAEAKSVLTAHHNANETTAKIYHLPKLVGGKIVEPAQAPDPAGRVEDKVQDKVAT